MIHFIFHVSGVQDVSLELWHSTLDLPTIIFPCPLAASGFVYKFTHACIPIDDLYDILFVFGHTNANGWKSAGETKPDNHVACGDRWRRDPKSRPTPARHRRSFKKSLDKFFRVSKNVGGQLELGG